MSYYQFNKKEILQKAKKNYSKENAAEYYLLYVLFLLSIKWAKTLEKFGVISEEFKLHDGVKNSIWYKNGETVKPLYINLPPMSGFIKYFENNRKTCHF